MTAASGWGPRAPTPRPGEASRRGRYRLRGERADAAWVISTHESEAEARYAEALFSVRYGLPTLPFSARPYAGSDGRSLVGAQALLDRLFLEHDTSVGGHRLLGDTGLRFEHPHFQAGTYTRTDVRRRRLAISLCGDRRGRTPMHRMALFGYDVVAARSSSSSASICGRLGGVRTVGGLKRPARTWRQSSEWRIGSRKRSGMCRSGRRPDWARTAKGSRIRFRSRRPRRSGPAW